MTFQGVARTSRDAQLKSNQSKHTCSLSKQSKDTVSGFLTLFNIKLNEIKLNERPPRAGTLWLGHDNFDSKSQSVKKRI